LLGRPGEAVILMNRSFILNPYVPSWYYIHHIRVAYFARLFDLVLDHFANLISRSVQMQLRAQKLFKALALAQFGRKAEVIEVISELRHVDPNLAIIQTEAQGLCRTALELLVDGLRKARRHDKLSEVSALGSPSVPRGRSGPPVSTA
jgi:hypothetical protein